MKIAVVGLGLIGGSLAKAIKEKTNHTVLGFDRDEGVLSQAVSSGAVDGVFAVDDVDGSVPDAKFSCGGDAGIGTVESSQVRAQSQHLSTVEMYETALTGEDLPFDAICDGAAQDISSSKASTADELPPKGKCDPFDCDILIIALYPAGTIRFLESNAHRINKNTIVMDCCGVKSAVCEAGFGLAREHGFTFVGGHPMAGTERSGFAAARADLFHGASMILVPDNGGVLSASAPNGEAARKDTIQHSAENAADCIGAARKPQQETACAKEDACAAADGKPGAKSADSKDHLRAACPEDDARALQKSIPEPLASLITQLGFGRMVVTTASEHDDTIAYTSQLAHVVSSAYIKSPTARNFSGFSAGSFKDMTRVAFLNEDMWAELFLDNREPLVREIDCMIQNLTAYCDAIKNCDKKGLLALLAEGKKAKLAADEKEKK